MAYQSNTSAASSILTPHLPLNAKPINQMSPAEKAMLVISAGGCATSYLTASTITRGDIVKILTAVRDQKEKMTKKLDQSNLSEEERSITQKKLQRAIVEEVKYEANLVLLDLRQEIEQKSTTNPSAELEQRLAILQASCKTAENLITHINTTPLEKSKQDLEALKSNLRQSGIVLDQDNTASTTYNNQAQSQTTNSNGSQTTTTSSSSPLATETTPNNTPAPKSKIRGGVQVIPTEATSLFDTRGPASIQMSAETTPPISQTNSEAREQEASSCCCCCSFWSSSTNTNNEQKKPLLPEPTASKKT